MYMMTGRLHITTNSILLVKTFALVSYMANAEYYNVTIFLMKIHTYHIKADHTLLIIQINVTECYPSVTDCVKLQLNISMYELSSFAHGTLLDLGTRWFTIGLLHY